MNFLSLTFRYILCGNGVEAIIKIIKNGIFLIKSYMKISEVKGEANIADKYAKGFSKSQEINIYQPKAINNKE